MREYEICSSMNENDVKAVLDQMQKDDVVKCVYDTIPGKNYRYDKYKCVAHGMFEIIRDHTTDPLMQFMRYGMKSLLSQKIQ